ncbi:HAMP domain-containing protein [candidate division KSB1 bacterium]|nr:HAMP domain-containing protein [candidate division KSB1 bacterium]
MTDWVKQQLNSKIFRRLFFAILAAAEVPMILVILLNPHSWFSDSRSFVANAVNVLLFLLLAAVVSGVIAFFLSRYLTMPISEFEKSATKIARGDFSHEITVQSDNEIGRLAKLFNYMTLELRRLDRMNLAKIIEEKRKLETIIKNIADGVIVTDPRLNVSVLNDSIRKWYNLQDEVIDSKPLTDYIEEPKLVQLIEDASNRKRKILPGVEMAVKPEGEWKTRILQGRAARVLQDDGVLIGVVTILRDVTQQKEIDRMKTELVSMVAHELRSPLTSISGFSELLLDDDITREQSEEYARIILTEASRLSDLINKFLDISRIESGRIQPKKAEIDLNETVQMVVGNNSYLAGKKNIEVEVHESPDMALVYADSGMMEQVFLNLFSNAIKYSHENTRIDIVVKNTERNVIVEVHDQGFGIPREALPKIFDKFYRVTDDQKVREVTGSGLGLSLVKQIVDMHNGHMEVDSEIGKGSVFTVLLPKMNGKRIENIVVEDSEDIIH